MRTTDHYMETPIKICPVCGGKCFEKILTPLSRYGKIIYLPAYKPCTNCSGDGYVYLTPDEIQDEHECRKDDEAEKMND